LEVEFTDEFQDWRNMLTEGQQDDLAHSVRHLMEFGPALGFPHSSKVPGALLRCTVDGKCTAFVLSLQE
jgi:hypothetical protein